MKKCSKCGDDVGSENPLVISRWIGPRGEWKPLVVVSNLEDFTSIGGTEYKGICNLTKVDLCSVDMCANCKIALSTSIAYFFDNKSVPEKPEEELDWIKKFWDQVDIQTDDECWDWMGKIEDSMGLFVDDEGTNWYSDVVAHVIEYGKGRTLKKRMEYLERAGIRCRCGNTLCCNPRHSFPTDPKVFEKYELERKLSIDTGKLGIEMYEERAEKLEGIKKKEPEWIVRFWKDVDIKGMDKCWNWKGKKVKYDTGYFEYLDGSEWLIELVAYSIKHGEGETVTDRLHSACHGRGVKRTCKEELCCNPSHIVLI